MVWGKLFLCSVNLTPVIKKKRKCGKGCVWLSSVTWVEFRRKRRIYTGFEYRHTDSHTRRPIQRYKHTQLNTCRLCMVNMLTLNNSQRKRAEEWNQWAKFEVVRQPWHHLLHLQMWRSAKKHWIWTRLVQMLTLDVSVVCRTCFAM